AHSLRGGTNRLLRRCAAFQARRNPDPFSKGRVAGTIQSKISHAERDQRPVRQPQAGRLDDRGGFHEYLSRLRKQRLRLAKEDRRESLFLRTCNGGRQSYPNRSRL